VGYRTDNPGHFGAGTKAARMLAQYRYGDWTDQEAASQAEHEQVPRSDAARRRGSQLRIAGYIADTGRDRPNPNTQAKGMVCCLTEAGRSALTRLETTGWSD
jgi:hypothetical protein